MTPYYEHAGITIYHGDCRDILPHIKADVVVTDPPYGVGIDVWDDRTPHELLIECLRGANGPVVWFGSSSNISIDLRSFAVVPDRVLVWAPRFTLSHTIKDGLAYRWQPVYVWRIPKSHSGPKWDVLDNNTECGNWWKHSCTKPVSLMMQLVGFSSSNNVVLDIFMGSGTTLVAAKQLGRKAIGIEIEEKYCEIAAKRLQQDYFQFEEKPLIQDTFDIEE